MVAIPTVVPTDIIDRINAKLNAMDAPDVTYDDMYTYIRIMQQDEDPNRDYVEWCLEGINKKQDDLRLYK